MKNWLILFLMLVAAISCSRTHEPENDLDYDSLKSSIITSISLDSISFYWNSLEIFTEQLQLSSDLSRYYKKQKDSTNFYLWNSRFLDLSLINGNSTETAEAYS